MYRGLDFKGFPNKFSFLTRKLWAVKKTLQDPYRPESLAGMLRGTRFLNGSTASSDWGWEPPVHHSPLLLILHEKAVIAPWLAGKEMPPSCFHSSVRSQSVQPVHRWSESPAISLEGFWRIFPKQRKKAGLKQWDCYSWTINIFDSSRSQNVNMVLVFQVY